MALAAGAGGAAIAYWTAENAGSGTASTGTSDDFTVTREAPVGDPLFPGGPSQSVTFTVVNDGAGSLRLTSVTATVANADGSAWTAAPGCSAADFTIGTPSISYGEVAGLESVTGTVTSTMNDLGGGQDGCQGVTVPLYLVAS